MTNPPVLGILGGGQLARMTAYAAFRLGLRVHVMEKFAGSPAGEIAHSETVGDPSDHELLRRFAAECDMVTLESEFIDEAHLLEIENAGGSILPSPHSVALIQDKLVQKQTLSDAGVPVAPFRGVGSFAEAARFGEEHGYPFLLKARRGGYDGYGNATVRSEEEIESAWEKITRGDTSRELYCEAFVPFVRELAVMVARSSSGETVLYPVVETVQENHICHFVVAPAPVDPPTAAWSPGPALRAVEAINGVGIFGIELFLLEDGSVLLNEMAPRPHNSGHYTIEGCETSQFENHIRAVMGWPLGSAELLAPGVAMANILGRANGPGTLRSYPAVLTHRTAHLHLYAKAESRIGRKMGHITVLAASPRKALEIAREAEAAVSFEA
jgi:5-(carboxyamino)imidazole ribonucleotide synthase